MLKEENEGRNRGWEVKKVLKEGEKEVGGRVEEGSEAERSSAHTCAATQRPCLHATSPSSSTPTNLLLSPPRNASPQKYVLKSYP
ncbi:hypothetical protein E2C01_022002 [Portunus trituberculatus]|uniref:Uncharacterized protein n=1 Tax=Portunus trituberculatus TaxID=210409 RepID=A0A5B7E432_PORTR|nr:hypothetical protein [Portunus trituberculatus]